MKEILVNVSDGVTMVTRFTLTQSGVNTVSFRPKRSVVSSSNDTSEKPQEAPVINSDYPYECSTIISEQTNWLDADVTVYDKIVLYNPRLEIITPFSENTKILVMSDHYTVKIFDIGGLTGNVELDFCEGDELIDNPENSEDSSKYFKSNGFRAVEIGDKWSPIILNPHSTDTPVTVLFRLVGNTDPSASGIFRISVRTIDE